MEIQFVSIQQFACQRYSNGKSYTNLLHYCTLSTALTTPASTNITSSLTRIEEEQVKDQSNWTAHCPRLVSGGKRWWSLHVTWILITFIQWRTGGRQNATGLVSLLWNTWCEGGRHERETRIERRISGQTARYQISMHSSWFILWILTLRRLMSYIYGAPILDFSRSDTTTQHSR